MVRNYGEAKAEGLWSSHNVRSISRSDYRNWALGDHSPAATGMSSEVKFVAIIAPKDYVCVFTAAPRRVEQSAPYVGPPRGQDYADAALHDGCIDGKAGSGAAESLR